MVTTNTTNALVVIFAPNDVSRAHLETVLDVTAARITAIAGGAEAARSVCG
jgi:DNA/RNA-binding domain of Phe-tRNA-synthetase-like protein